MVLKEFAMPGTCKDCEDPNCFCAVSNSYDEAINGLVDVIDKEQLNIQEIETLITFIPYFVGYIRQ